MSHSQAPAGYFLLEDCDIALAGEIGPPLKTWHDVINRHGDTAKERQRFCNRCELILDYANIDGSICLDIESVAVFQGTLQDLATQSCSCGRRRRTDASLAVGLLMACQDCAVITRLQVLYHDPYRASLILEVSAPHLQGGGGSILPKSRGKKCLSSALQLLLVLIQSDWEELEKRKRELITLSDDRIDREPSDFFPSRFGLESIYKWINQHQYKQRRRPPLDNSTSVLTSLPPEVLCEKLAPFLNAGSLACLRGCNRGLHRLLRAVVPGLRKLRLYQHQVDSLSWMRTRETPLTELETWGHNHRAVTAGATATLGDGCVVDTVTGRVATPPVISRNVARGGMLCDDPGLGKTITVLSLILQTTSERGQEQSTIPCVDDAHGNTGDEVVNGCFENKDDEDKDIFHVYWLDNVVHEYRLPVLLKLLNDLSKAAVPQFSLALRPLKMALEAKKLGADFTAFEEAVKQTIREATKDDDDSRGFLLSKFQALVDEFKDSQQRSARKAFSNASSKPNSRVAAVIEERTRNRHLESLVQSTATLIVTPSVLIDHWISQMEQHADFRYWTRREPLIFQFLPRGDGMTVDRATILCDLDKTHDAVVFVDRASTRPLPPASFLAKFRVVITSTNRFQNEWKKGSFQQELARKNPEGGNAHIYFFMNSSSASEASDCCELLKVHWNRMVVDEGHSMGNDRMNASIQFASWISAKNRWVMTGTPTKQTSAQIGQLNRLITFLEHDFFTPRLNGDVYWKQQIVRGWRSGDLASFFRICHLLQLLMKRHTKLDIIELLPPAFNHQLISMSFAECTTYNTFVSSIQTNLLMTSMEGKTSGAQDSLLHKTQSRNARSTLQSIRRVCTGFGRAVATLPFAKHSEFLQAAHSSGLPQSAKDAVSSYVDRARKEELTACCFCHIELSILILMSCCGGLICTECMDNKTKVCYLCESSFDVDELQQFQPGFELRWKENYELMSAATQAEPSQFSGTIAQVNPGKVRRKTKRFNDGHNCQYDPCASDGICDLCLAEHDNCNLMNEGFCCRVCFRTAEECPAEESKSSYLIGKLLKLHALQSAQAILITKTPVENRAVGLKVIVFSQFRAALNMVGHRLLKKYGSACIAEYFGKHRKQELQKFANSSECFCLLLTKDGGEGLDLSFVTNIFFLEEIYDESVQQQAVARAWRMGAKQRVNVETLVARSSVEETMLQQSQSTTNDDSIVSGVADQQRLKSLLQSLTFITDFHSFAPVACLSQGANISSSPDRAPRELPTRKRRRVSITSDAANQQKKIRFALSVDSVSRDARSDY